MKDGGWIFLVHGGTGPGRDRVTKAIEAAGWAWWHWFDNVWLVPGFGAIEPLKMIEWLRAISNDGSHWLVLKADGTMNWAAIVDSKASDWLQKNWKKEADAQEALRKVLGL